VHRLIFFLAFRAIFVLLSSLLKLYCDLKI